MDNRDREGVGGIIGFRDFIEMEMQTDHFLDLGLVGLAIAADGFLDLVGGVFEGRQVALLGDEQADATSLCDRNARGDILFEKSFSIAMTSG